MRTLTVVGNLTVGGDTSITHLEGVEGFKARAADSLDWQFRNEAFREDLREFECFGRSRL